MQKIKHQWFMNNGEELLRTWTTSPLIERVFHVTQSRKEHVCILGSVIEKGSSYHKLDILCGGGCGASFITVALSPTVSGLLKKLDNKISMDFQSVNDWLDNLDGDRLFELLHELDYSEKSAIYSNLVD